MPPIAIRPFRRSDRDQLTDLVNMHVEAVLPGVTVSPNAVLSQLEREPGEPVVDPWVTHRHTLVAVVREAVVGAAHLLRYADEERVGAGYRGLGEIRWLLVGPGQNPEQAAEMRAVADALTAAAVAHLRACRRIAADFGLPAPAVYGVSDRWPHLAAALSRARLPSGRAGGSRARGRDRRPAARRLRSRAGPGAAGGARRARHPVLRRARRHGDRLLRGRHRPHPGRHPLPPRRVGRRLGALDRGRAPPPRRRDLAARARRRPHALRGRPPVLDYAILAPEPPDGTYPFLRHVGFHELTRTTRSWTPAVASRRAPVRRPAARDQRRLGQARRDGRSEGAARPTRASRTSARTSTAATSC